MSKLLVSSGASSVNISRQSISSTVSTAISGKGDIYDSLRAAMGEAQYRKLEASDCLRLIAIYIRSTTLRGSGDKKGIVNHDIVVVELEERCPESGRVLLRHILAEKANDRDCCTSIAGIHIQWWPGFKFDNKLDVKYDGFGTPIRLGQVVEVLKCSSPDYDLIDANCWHYAATVTRDLFLKLLYLVKNDQCFTAPLQNVLNKAQQHLEDTKTIIPKAVGASTIGLVGVAILGVTATILSNLAMDDATKEEKEDIED